MEVSMKPKIYPGLLVGGSALLVLAASGDDLGVLLNDLRRHAPALEQLI